MLLTHFPRVMHRLISEDDRAVYGDKGLRQRRE